MIAWFVWGCPSLHGLRCMRYCVYVYLAEYYPMCKYSWKQWLRKSGLWVCSMKSLAFFTSLMILRWAVFVSLLKIALPFLVSLIFILTSRTPALVCVYIFGIIWWLLKVRVVAGVSLSSHALGMVMIILREDEFCRWCLSPFSHCPSL